jgi:YVTN family beta-propeller protein
LITDTNTVTATIPVATPGRMAVSPDGSLLYVTNVGSNPSGSVSLIDTATNTVITTVPVGNFPTFVAVSPDGTHLYVVNSFGDTVSVITIGP